MYNRSEVGNTLDNAFAYCNIFSGDNEKYETYSGKKYPFQKASG